jgi:hypothetical protein
MSNGDIPEDYNAMAADLIAQLGWPDAYNLAIQLANSEDLPPSRRALWLEISVAMQNQMSVQQPVVNLE